MFKLFESFGNTLPTTLRRLKNLPPCWRSNLFTKHSRVLDRQIEFAHPYADLRSEGKPFTQCFLGCGCRSRKYRQESHRISRHIQATIDQVLLGMCRAIRVQVDTMALCV